MPLLAALFHRVGLFIGRHPLTVFLLNLLLFLPWLSYFLFYEPKIETDVRRGFAHRNGRAAKEFQAFGEYYNVSMDGLEILLVFVESKQRGHQLPIDSTLLAEIERLDTFIKDQSVEMAPSATAAAAEGQPGKMIRLKELQTGRGEVNFLFKAYKWAHDRQDAQLSSGGARDSQIQLKYPVSRIYGFDVPLSPHFFGVQSHSGSNSSGEEKPVSEMASARTIALWYMFEGKGPQMRELLSRMEMRLFETAKAGNFSTKFDVHLYGDEIANREMMRGSQRTMRLLSIGIAAMVAFMLIAFSEYHWKSQLLLICLALLSPSLAISVTFALIGWLGINFNSIMSIMPFLVLGIGVDNAFLLLHSWRKWTKAAGPQKDVAQRMAGVVQEMGPSMAITSITNGLAFGIGIFSPASLMSSFCLCTTVAIFLDFLFEFLVFAPCLPLIRWKKSKPEGSLAQRMRVSFCRHYARFVVSRWSRLCCLCLLLFLYSMALFGIFRMDATFEPQKTFPGDSPLQYSIAIANRVMMEHSPVSLIVFRPPDISDPSQLTHFQQMISAMESLPNTRHVDLWLRDYLEYDQRQFNQSSGARLNSSSPHWMAQYEPSYALVPRYLRERMLEDKRIVDFRQQNGTTVRVDKFVFVLSRQGAVDWHHRAHFVERLRALVDRYPEFNTTVFDYDSTIYDLILTVKTEMLKSVLVTLFCMALVCFLVIPSVRHTGVATFSVLSISFSLIGALGWWGLDWDPVTMINVLMAIGFSVDFSAHICYHYDKIQQRQQPSSSLSPTNRQRPASLRLQCSQLSAERQIEMVLNAVGRPMLEAAGSTVICVFPLFFLSIYIIEAFARTVFCVGALGTVHGLFIVPVLLSLELGGAKGEKLGKESGKSTASSQQPLVDNAIEVGGKTEAEHRAGTP